VVKPPLTLVRTGKLRDDIQINTQLLAHTVEKAVRDYSDQWFWFHKRWKQYHPFLYREDLAHRKRKKKIRKKRARKKAGTCPDSRSKRK
jgi:KDO2-lipid IV(A) lauroyltransferase